jgi:hypothetical protein
MGTIHRCVAFALTVATTAGGAQSCDTANNGNGSGDSGSGGGGIGACQIDTRGIEKERNAVTDVLTARCDPSPKSHTLEGWLEYRKDGGDWVPHESKLQPTVPDAEGVTLRLVEPCATGRWRARWKTYGVGPPPASKWWNEEDGDFFSTYVEC